MSAVPPLVAESSVDESTFTPALQLETEPTSALDRVSASRERLRLAMQKPKKPSPSKLSGRGIGSYGASALAHLKEIPALAVLLAALENWWSQHPLRTAAIVGAEASRTLVEPLARRNPLMLMLGALLFGCLLARARPWRWILRPALLAGLLPQLASQAIRQLPLESWMSMVAGLSRPRAQARRPARQGGSANTASSSGAASRAASPPL